MRRVLVFSAIVFCCAGPRTASAEDGTLPSLGVTYQSEYFWRGLAFYGLANASRGVLLPWVAQSAGDFRFVLGGEVGVELLEGQGTDLERAWGGIDFIGSYETSFRDNRIAVGGWLAYYWYPKSSHLTPGGYPLDFGQINAWVRFPESLLQPAFEYSHILRRSDFGGQREALRDVSLRASIEHPVELAEGFVLTIGGWIRYFFYASSEFFQSPSVGGRGDDYRGISDIVAFTRLSVTLPSGWGLSAGFNVAVVPDVDFYSVWGEDDRLHVWADFGFSYAF